jgi:hypothetical protein
LILIHSRQRPERPQTPSPDPLEGLTPREREILENVLNSGPRPVDS